MAQLCVATIRSGAGAVPVLVRDGMVHRIAGAVSVRSMLGDWDAWLGALDAGRVEDPVPLADCALMAPVPERIVATQSCAMAGWSL